MGLQSYTVYFEVCRYLENVYHRTFLSSTSAVRSNPFFLQSSCLEALGVILLVADTYTEIKACYPRGVVEFFGVPGATTVPVLRGTIVNRTKYC